MILISRRLPLAFLTFVTLSVTASAHAAIIVKGSLDLPHLSERSIILDDVGTSVTTSNDTLDRLETTTAPVPQIAPTAAVIPQFLPVNPPLDEPVGNSVKSTADTAETLPEALSEPQPGPEPYVMLLIGLGMIVVAITLHLKPIQHRRSGFQPSQGMPFV